MDKVPDISIIICTYNGANTIDKCISTLLQLNYPKEKYEIVIINDGSKDTTLSVIEKLPVKIKNNIKNLGRAAARNVGLGEATGPIVAYVDDDCEPEPNWIKEIMKSYSDKNVMGVGGTTLPTKKSTLAELYQSEIRYGNPSPLEFEQGNNLVKRFLIYVKTMFHQQTSGSAEEALEIYTGNATYRKSNLEQIGGFDEKLPSYEDSDVSFRLRKHFPEEKLIWNKHAVVKNNYNSSLLGLTKQAWSRSPDRFRFFTKHNKIPTVYPLPFALLVLLLLSINKLNVFGLLILPHVVYPWWPFRAIKSKNYKLLFFSYFQPIIEFISVLGYIKVVKNKQ